MLSHGISSSPMQSALSRSHPLTVENMLTKVCMSSLEHDVRVVKSSNLDKLSFSCLSVEASGPFVASFLWASSSVVLVFVDCLQLTCMSNRGEFRRGF